MKLKHASLMGEKHLSQIATHLLNQLIIFSEGFFGHGVDEVLI